MAMATQAMCVSEGETDGKARHTQRLARVMLIARAMLMLYTKRIFRFVYADITLLQVIS